jgi:hypothetical protein
VAEAAHFGPQPLHTTCSTLSKRFGSNLAACRQRNGGLGLLRRGSMPDFQGRMSDGSRIRAVDCIAMTSSDALGLAQRRHG